MKTTSCADVLNKVLCGYSDLLSVDDLVRLTGRSARTVRIDINAGRLPGCRIGGRLFVPKSKFIDFILNRNVRTNE